MDKGEILKQGFEVRPAENGGFVVLGGDYDDAEIVAALSTADALVEWLRQEAIGLRAQKAPAGTDPDVYLQAGRAKGL